MDHDHYHFFKSLSFILSSFILLLEIVLVILITYLVLFKSGRMGIYRFYILNSTISSFLLTLSLILIPHTPTFPKSCVYITPNIAVSNITAKYYFLFLITILIFTDLSEMWSMINRFAHAHPNLHDFFYKKHKIFSHFVLISFNITLTTTVCSLFYFESPKNEEEMIKEIDYQLGSFNEIHSSTHDLNSNGGISNNKAIFCFYKNFEARFGIGLVIVGILAFFAIGMTMVLRLFHVIYGNSQNTISISKSLNLQVILCIVKQVMFVSMFQKMLFKAFTVQFVIGILLLLIPLAIYLGVYVIQIPNGGKIASYCVLVVPLNGVFQNLSILYFITPYRQAIVKVFMKSNRISIIHVSVTTVTINK